MSRSALGACFVVIVLAAGLARAQEAEPVPAPTPRPAAGGLAYRSADGATVVEAKASLQLDLREHGADSVAPGGFDIRRARLEMRGQAAPWMRFRIQAAFENEPYIRNAWFDLERSAALHLRIGQMKVPFSTSWLTEDNQVNFTERATAAPLYPFFDRGVLLWGDLAGRRLWWSAGAFTGAGVDVDAPSGDVDDHQDIAGRVVWSPLGRQGDRGLHLAAQATTGRQSVPTRRFELRGLTAANQDSKVWRWRTEQLLGSNGRSTDRISATVRARDRVGLEAHWLSGPFTVSAEWLEVRWDDVAIAHEHWQGQSLLRSDPVMVRDGGVRSTSVWASWSLTGERKRFTPFGWEQPRPKGPVEGFGRGLGAWEVLARLSTTETDEELFDTVRVHGYTAAELDPVAGVPVGAGESVRAAVLQGAREVREATVGVNWTLDSRVRFQLNGILLWVPDFEEGVNGIVSGGSSSMADQGERNRLVERELSVVLRCIFRI